MNGDGKHNQPKNNLSVYTQGTFISYIQDDNAKITVNGIGPTMRMTKNVLTSIFKNLNTNIIMMILYLKLEMN